jgi:hypothetical protein
LLAVLNLLPLGLVVNDFYPTLARHYPRQRRIAAGVGVVLVGVLIPVGLLLVGGGVAIAIAAMVALVAANLGVRWVIVHLPHLVTAA